MHHDAAFCAFRATIWLSSRLVKGEGNQKEIAPSLRERNVRSDGTEHIGKTLGRN